MPYVLTDTVVSLRSVSAGVARAGLPYFTAWPQTLGERPQRGVHLHDTGCGRGGTECNVLSYPWTHGTSGSVKTALVEQIQIASFSLMEN